MTASARLLLDAFEGLPEPDRHVIAAEILRRTLQDDPPPLDDEALSLAAEDLFLALDAREANDAPS